MLGSNVHRQTEGECNMAEKGEELEIDAEMFESLIRRLFEGKGILKKTDDLSLYERCRYSEEQFRRTCLKLARSEPCLCAEAVESEEALTMLGLRPPPADEWFM